MSRISSRTFSLLSSFCIIALALALFGCATITPEFPPGEKIPRGAEKPIKKEEPRPRAIASLRLTEQGKLLLESGKPDDAIRVLERAVNMNPTNGQNYYYLSKAWLLKGNISQAQEFNRLAEMYLKGEPEWVHRVLRQREQIERAGK